MNQADIDIVIKEIDDKIDKKENDVKELHVLKKGCEDISEISTMETNDDGSAKKDGYGMTIYRKSNPIERELYHKRGTVISDEARSLSLTAIKTRLDRI